MVLIAPLLIYSSKVLVEWKKQIPKIFHRISGHEHLDFGVLEIAKMPTENNNRTLHP